MTSLVSDAYQYEVTPRVLDGTNFRTLLQSEASSYSLGDVVRIAIPNVHNGFLNTTSSWFNITMKIDSLEGVAINESVGGAAGMRYSYIGCHAIPDIVSIVSPNGQYLENTTNYQQQFAMNWCNNTDLGVASPNSITNNLCDPTTVRKYSRVQGNVVEGLTINAGKTSAVGTITEKWSPTLSCMLNSSTCIPLTWFASEAFVEITITRELKNILCNTFASGTVTGGSATFTFELDACIDVVSDNSKRLIEQKAGYGAGPISWSSTQQRSSLHSLSLAELNASGVSIKSNVIGGVRPRKLLSIQQSAFVRDTKGHLDRWACCNPYSNGSFQLRVGTELYPPRPIVGIAEQIRHTNKIYNQGALTTLNNRLDNDSTSFNTTNYGPRLNETTGARGNTNRGTVGYDFTCFDGNTDGLDTTSVIIESLGGVGKTSTNPEVANAVSPYEVISLKRFQVLYSVDTAGNVSVSY